MNCYRFPALSAAFLFAALVVTSPAETAAAGSAPLNVPASDPQIEKIVREISPANIEAIVAKLVSFKTRHTLSTATDPKIGIGAARTWIESELERYSRESGGRLVVTLDKFHQPPDPRAPQGVEVVNVVATLPGTAPWAKDRVYVVSGHYDSRVIDILNADTVEPGADDDASGVAVSMELARVMSHYRFDATIVFLAVAGEEQALYGSTHWAKTARANHVDVGAMFTNDIVGNTLDEHGVRDRSYVRVFAAGVPPRKNLPPAEYAQIRTGGENDFPARELARYIATTAAHYVPDLGVKMIYRLDRYLRGGDHAPFLEAGYPAVRFTEPHEVFSRQHQDVRVEHGIEYGDTLKWVDFGYVAQVARVNGAALAGLASAPAAPRDVEIDALELENDTTLEWAPNTEPDLAGYRIVWRDTTAPQWQHSLDVPKNVTRTTVRGVSKDDFIFGVEAIDTAGHTSFAVYPRPRLR